MYLSYRLHLNGPKLPHYSSARNFFRHELVVRYARHWIIPLLSILFVYVLERQLRKRHSRAQATPRTDASGRDVGQ